MTEADMKSVDRKASDRTEAAQTVRIWDPIVRIGHWLLVVAFFTAYLTEDDFQSVHVIAGYVVAGVILVRILWGFVGPKHARFSDFLYAPAKVIEYLRQLVRRRSPRYLGHSPAGGAMVFALLFSLAVTGWSGMMLYAYEENAGPLAEFVVADSVVADHEAWEEDHEAFWEELHEIFANLTLLLVGLHIGGVLLASFAHRENLVQAMISGDKPAARPDDF